MSALAALRRIFRQVPRAAEARRGDAAAYHRPARIAIGAPDPFTDKYIFPGYPSAVAVADVAASEKARLIASDIEILRLHYAYTLRHWLDRVTKAREQDRGDVRRALLSHVGILSRRRHRHVRERRRAATTRSNMSATATPCRSRATTWPRPRIATGRSASTQTGPTVPAGSPRTRTAGLARAFRSLRIRWCICLRSSGVRRPSRLASAPSKWR